MNSEDANEPSQTFFATVPERDQQLIKITTNPPQYSLIESDEFSFSGSKTVYIEPNLYAFYGDPCKLEVWQYSYLDSPNMVCKVQIGGGQDKRSNFALTRTGDSQICVIGGLKKKKIIAGMKTLRSVLCFNLANK